MVTIVSVSGSYGLRYELIQLSLQAGINRECIILLLTSTRRQEYEIGFCTMR